MIHTANVGDAKRQPGQCHPVAVAFTRFFAGIRRGAMALSMLLLLSALPGMAQSMATVTRFDDTNSTSGSGYPGLGAGAIDSSGNKDLRYAMQQAIYYGGTWTIRFSSTCTVTNPCKITLTNPLPPITSKSSNPLVLTIDGGEFGEVIVDGAGSYRAFFVDDATVTLANLQIQNAKAKGGDGGWGETAGGGGGAGLGAGVFVNTLLGQPELLAHGEQGSGNGRGHFIQRNQSGLCLERDHLQGLGGDSWEYAHRHCVFL